MQQQQWTAVDEYVTARLAPPDPVLDGALRNADRAGLPHINVSPAQGQFLHVLAAAAGARHVLEIGTLAGYSAIWLGRALPPDGRLISLEAEPRHAEVARENLAAAGLADRVEVRLGPALDTLPNLRTDPAAPFDLVFIDADKPNIPEYFRWALVLSRPGALVVVDNVVRKGALADETSTDPAVQGVRRLHDMLADETRAAATTIQTVGVKGYDGFTLAVVRDAGQ
ncbi:O-methyltransferase [Saccharopolyspora rosea]|uniref:O-methyltransferase n=1 Tax=Saccharopolyspora rosea TaxID=524884 RepID=A0ABW3FTD4_9PSEU|nr:O-methyltransferase [Saccharopolyspora rosea]